MTARGRSVLRSAAAALAAAAAGCGPRAAEPEFRERAHARRAGEFSLLTYVLGRYTYDDRDGDGQRNNPKPEAERAAAADLLARIGADVLVLQDIGPLPLLEELAGELRRRGADYPHRKHAIRPGADTGLAVLSRFPIVGSAARMDDAYRIGPTNLPVLRGFLDVEIEPTPGRRVRLFVAHLKSKTYHPLGQTEMRRNEARLLANHVRRALRETPSPVLAVAGAFHDVPGSAPLKELLGDGETRLVDLRPADGLGDAWTHHDPDSDTYSRVDYILASPALADAMERGPTRAVRDARAAAASPHRPIVAVFRTDALGAPPGGEAAGPSGGRGEP